MSGRIGLAMLVSLVGATSVACGDVVESSELAESSPSAASLPAPRVVVAALEDSIMMQHPAFDPDSFWTNPGEIPGDGIDNDGNGVIDDVHGYDALTDSGQISWQYPDEGWLNWNDQGTFTSGLIVRKSMPLWVESDDGYTYVKTDEIVPAAPGYGHLQIMGVTGMHRQPASGTQMLRSFEKGVDYIVMMKARGVNVRVASAAMGWSVYTPEEVERWNAAARRLLDADILLVAAAGSNDPEDVDTEFTTLMPALIDSPNVITVTAANATQDALAEWAPWGLRTIDIAAQGDDIIGVDWFTGPGSDELNANGCVYRTGGTVTAPTAILAAVAGRVAEANPRLTALEIKDVLMRSARKLPTFEGKLVSGGVVDLDAAIAMATELAKR